MTVRPAKLGDVFAMARLHGASFDDGWVEADFITWLGREHAWAVVAGDDREPFAFGLALTSGDDAELLTIATDPARRGQGLGRKVLRGLDAEASARGLNRWILEVGRNNLPAQALYRSEGFLEIGLRKAYYQTREGRVDALVMARPVGGGGGQGGP